MKNAIDKYKNFYKFFSLIVLSLLINGCLEKVKHEEISSWQVVEGFK